MRGHFSGGHYLSACALTYASAGDEELRRKADELIQELARCQKAHGNGYLSAFPEEFFDRLREGRPVWAPFYTLHTIMAGHLDMYVHGGNEQALATLEGMADWVGRWVSSLRDEHMQRVLEVEHGGMLEALLNLYAVTGKERYLRTALRFDHHAFFDPLAGRLGGKDLTPSMVCLGYSSNPARKPIPVPSIQVDPRHPTGWVEPVVHQTLSFRTVGQKQILSLIPLYQLSGERYVVYSKVQSSAA